MIYDAFRREERDAYWILGSGLFRRHAMTTQPGAVFCGQWVPALCETWLKIPNATPYHRAPASRSVTTRCEECTEHVQRHGYFDNTWDF